MRRQRNDLYHVQRAAGHSNEANLQRNAESMKTASARRHDLLIRCIEREKLIEIEGGQLARELLQTEPGRVPAFHGALPFLFLGEILYA